MNGGDRERTYLALRAQVAALWGEPRAAATEATLRRTADSIWKLAQLEFRNDERPGFFLGDIAGNTDFAGKSDVADDASEEGRRG